MLQPWFEQQITVDFVRANNKVITQGKSLLGQQFFTPINSTARIIRIADHH